MTLRRWSIISVGLLAGLAAGPVAAQEGEEGVRINCFKCQIGYCYEYQYKTVAPRVLITRFRANTWFPRSDEVIVPNTNGQWTEMLKGRQSMSGYDYVEVNLAVGPNSSRYIATQSCKTGWTKIN